MADTLTAVRLMPTLEAASSSSPTARSTAPARERSTSQNRISTSSTNVQVNATIRSDDQPFWK